MCRMKQPPRHNSFKSNEQFHVNKAKSRRCFLHHVSHSNTEGFCVHNGKLEATQFRLVLLSFWNKPHTTINPRQKRTNEQNATFPRTQVIQSAEPDICLPTISSSTRTGEPDNMFNTRNEHKSRYPVCRIHLCCCQWFKELETRQLHTSSGTYSSTSCSTPKDLFKHSGVRVHQINCAFSEKELPAFRCLSTTGNL